MKFKKLTIFFSISLCVVCALGWVLMEYTPSKRARYHQHIEEASDASRTCEHADDSFCTHLPLLCVDTNGETIPGNAYYDEDGNKIITTAPNGDPYVTVSISVTDRADANNHLADDPTQTMLAQMNIRGNSSRHFIKYGYALTLVDELGANSPAEMMGMDSHHDWVIHGPILDKSLIRNYMWYNIGGEIMDYAPNVRFFEMFINGEYEGVYIMTERITAGDMDSRLNLSVSKKNNIFTGFCVRYDRGAGELKDLNEARALIRASVKLGEF